MPELPEVETIRRGLQKLFVGHRLRSIDVRDPKLLQDCTELQLKQKLAHQRLQSIGRRAKFLLLDFGRHTVALHLRMTGWLSTREGPRYRLKLTFDHDKELFFEDTRRFGTLHLLETRRIHQSEPLKNLGLEPLSSRYTFSRFCPLLGSRREIKQLLLDQTKVAGLGNIYACEALYRARIHPARPAHKLSPDESRRLHGTIAQVLRRAIDEQGTSVDTYRLLDGSTGNFQNLLQVYDREGKPCYRCRTQIKRIVQGGRSSYYCPKCQPRDSFAM